MTFRNSILAGVTLIREAIQSQNYQAGVEGWTINADGTAEFSDLTIRSSDGSGNTVTIANGVITIRNSNGDVVSTISQDGYKVWDSTGADLLAEVTLAGGTLSGPGFIARYDAFPYIYSFFGDGGIQWVNEQTDMFNEPHISMTALAVEDDEISMSLNPGAYTSSGNQPRLTLATSALGNSEVRMDAGFGSDPDIKMDGQVLVHGTDIGRGTQDFASTTASTALAAVETIGITSGSMTFETGRAYRATLHYQGSGNTSADVIGFRIRRTNVAGNSLFDSLRTHQLNANGAIVNGETSQLIYNNTGAPLTTVLVGTVYRVAGAGNVQMFANAANPVWIHIEDVGVIGDYPGIKAM